MSGPEPERSFKACRGLVASLAIGVVILSGCSVVQPVDKDEVPKELLTQPAPDAVIDSKTNESTVRLITAQTPAVRAYRKSAAAQIYKAYAKRIHKGKIPPLVYAVVVVETDIDASGKVLGVFYSRVPSHAPEVPPQIAELIKGASPLPSPGALGAHTYVETWLWDKSGSFQLDTLTLGQRSR